MFHGGIEWDRQATGPFSGTFQSQDCRTVPVPVAEVGFLGERGLLRGKQRGRLMPLPTSRAKTSLCVCASCGVVGGTLLGDKATGPATAPFKSHL